MGFKSRSPVREEPPETLDPDSSGKTLLRTSQIRGIEFNDSKYIYYTIYSLRKDLQI